MTKLNWNRPPQKQPGWSLDAPKRPRGHKHKYAYVGKAGIFDPQRIFKCRICGRRIVRPPKPKTEQPLAR